VKVLVVEPAVVNLLRVAKSAEKVLVATTATLTVLTSGLPVVNASLFEMVMEKASVSETVAKTALAWKTKVYGVHQLAEKLRSTARMPQTECLLVRIIITSPYRWRSAASS
jgi:hypothetical protein